MATKNLYFDESGFTGYNLLDPHQPIFTIASTSINPVLAEDLLRKAFPLYKAEEFKFANIYRPSNQTGLAALWHEVSQLPDQVYQYVIDKKFAALVKIVDFLVEPGITAAGYDFYADGFCWKYANYIHFGLTRIAPINIYDELIGAYQTFSKKPSISSLNTLIGRLKDFEKDADLETKPFLTEMIFGAESLTSNFHIDTFRDTNDLYLSTMLAIVCYWRQNHIEDFRVIHDASSIFMRNRETWHAITNPEVTPQPHPLGDGSTVEYPLRVTETISVNSKDNYSVQLCDLLAGFTSTLFKAQNYEMGKKDIAKIAMDSGFGNFISNSIMPGHIFPKFPPKRLNGPDAVDLMTKIIAKDF